MKKKNAEGRSVSAGTKETGQIVCPSCGSTDFAAWESSATQHTGASTPAEKFEKTGQLELGYLGAVRK
jgi:hypothetical protein